MPCATGRPCRVRVRAAALSGVLRSCTMRDDASCWPDRRRLPRREPWPCWPSRRSMRSAPGWLNGPFLLGKAFDRVRVRVDASIDAVDGGVLDHRAALDRRAVLDRLVLNWQRVQQRGDDRDRQAITITPSDTSDGISGMEV